MTLTNYWWLLIWLFAGGAIFGNMPKRLERLNGETVERWDPLPAILLVLPFILWAGFRHDYFGDTRLYRVTFLNLPAGLSQIYDAFANDAKDPGFTAFSVLMKNIIGNQDKLFFLTIAAFQMICVAKTFRKYASDYWICIFLFVVSTDYLSWMHNGMRQFIAVAGIFACFDLMLKKKYIPLVLVILLLSTIHGSALLMIPIIFLLPGKAWGLQNLFVLAGTLLIMLFPDRFTPILEDLLVDTQYDDIMTNGIWATDDGTNMLRVAIYSVPAIMSLVGLKYVRAANDPVINLCVNGSIITMALYLISSVTSGIYIGRLPIYTSLMGYIALPWLIDHMFTRESARLVRNIMIALYLLFFYFQMHFGWGVL